MATHLGGGARMEPGDAGSNATTPDAAPGDAGGDASPPAGERLAIGQLRPSSLRVSGETIYWLLDAAGQGAVMKMPSKGGAPAAIATDLVQPDALQIDVSSAYFLAYGEQAGIHKVSLSGGPTTKLVSSGTPVSIQRIALDEKDVYYTDVAAGALKRVDKNGGTPSTFAAGLSGPTDIAIDDSGVYVIESGESGAVLRFPLEGGAPTTIAAAQADPRGLVLTETHVYWIDSGIFDVTTQMTTGAGVMRSSKSGGAPAQVVKVEGVNALAVDGAWVYFAAEDAILRAPAAGGAPPNAIAPMQRHPRAIVAADRFVYWANAGTATAGFADGDVRRLAK